MSAVHTLFKSFGQFFSGFALLYLLGFITFPILTRLLSREDYGILGLVTTTMGIVVAFAKGGLSDGIVRFYGDYSATPERLTIFTSTVLTRGVLLAAAVVGVYLLALPHIDGLIDLNRKYLACFQVMALYVFVRPLNVIVMNYLRAVGNLLLFNYVNVSIKLAEIALGFSMLLWIVGELSGYLLGTALAEAGATVFLYHWLFRTHRFALAQVSGGLALDLFKFGAPLLLTELAYLLLTYTDRYMIVAYHGAGMLGLYSVGYNIPSYINNLVMFSLSYAVVPIYTDLYRREGRTATETFLSRATKYYLMGTIPLCVGYAAIARDALIVLASHKYAEAAAFSPIVLIGLVFLGLNYILYAGLYLEKKSGQILAVMLCAVAINIGANLLLLPRYGVGGAAIATLIACLVSSSLLVVLSRRHLRISIPRSTIPYYIAASAVMYVGITSIETGRPLLNLLTRVPLGIAIMLVAALARESEVRALALKLIRRASGRDA